MFVMAKKMNHEQRVYTLLGSASIIVLAFGTVFYHLIEGWSLIDAYYFSVVTLTTVGYGDLTPHSSFARLFTTFYIFIGIGIIATFVRTALSRRGQKIIDRYSDHHLLTGEDPPKKPKP